MQKGKKIYDPFIPKEEQDYKKIGNGNGGKIDEQQINNCSNISNLQSKESKINGQQIDISSNIRNSQSINKQDEIQESKTNMLNTQHTQNNRHPLNDVCGHNLSWLDCCNICGQQVINGK